MGRGVRQGSPISPFIFITAIEPLLRKLTSSVKGISFYPPGLSLPTMEWKSAFTTTVTALAYADDLAVGCNDPIDLTNTINIIAHFGTFSGCTINNDKTILYSHSNNMPIYRTIIHEQDLHIHHQPISINPRYLGSPLLKMDWPRKFNDLLEKLRRILFLDLTLSHRVTAINTYIFSQIYFMDQHHPCSSTDLQHFIDEIINMLTRSLPHRLVNIKDILYATRKQGGLGLLDLHSQITGRRGFYLFQLVRRSSSSHPLLRMMKSLLQQLANNLVRNQTVDQDLNSIMTSIFLSPDPSSLRLEQAIQQHHTRGSIATSGLLTIPYYDLLYPAMNFTFAPNWKPTESNIQTLCLDHTTNLNLPYLTALISFWNANTPRKSVTPSS
ncbi:unnamed protein product [Ambrosiozyma monospora]|uniref:Unnamed protein product n=1 Tax=Ambrosiozyma monospora TaxID=43982 RepID=A0A9W7DFU3_AMBMO|nr:unnamed protein product [Ambrosiozyma monospora]